MMNMPTIGQQVWTVSIHGVEARTINQVTISEFGTKAFCPKGNRLSWAGFLSDDQYNLDEMFETRLQALRAFVKLVDETTATLEGARASAAADISFLEDFQA